jgi:Protein of unknown function (DUF1587)
VGGLDLTSYRSESEAMKNREVWEKVDTRVKNHEMPPNGRPAPSPEEIAKVTGWIDGATARLDKNVKPDPGRVTARRLNRVEYSNTIRDLLGAAIQLSQTIISSPRLISSSREIYQVGENQYFFPLRSPQKSPRNISHPTPQGSSQSQTLQHPQ